MSKKDHLFELIQSLDKSEKRYFKLAFSDQVKDKKYIKLFDVLERTEIYDEKKIKYQIKDAYLEKHYAETKYYLYQQILKVLKEYRTQHSIDNILLDKLQNIEILIQKALFDQAIKELTKAKKMAYEYERFEFVLLLITYQNKIIVSTRLQGFNEARLDEFWVEKKSGIKNFIDTQTARHKVLQLMESKNRIGYIKTKEDKQFYNNIKNEIEQLLQQANCSIAKMYAIESLIFYYNHIDEKKMQNYYCRELILLHTQNPAINASHPYQLPSAIHNLCLSEINLLNFDAAKKWICIQKSYLQIIQNDSEIKYKVEWSLASLQSYFYNVSGRFDEGKNIVKEIIQWIEATDEIDQRSKWIFYGNCAEISLGAINFNTFFYCINKIQEYWNQIDSYNKINYIILQMFAHLYEKNIESVQYLFSFLEKEINMVRKNNPTPIEIIILEFFKKIQQHKKSDKKITELVKETQLLLKAREHEIQTGEFEYALWLEQLLSKNSYENLVRQKRKIEIEKFIPFWNEEVEVQVDIEAFKKNLPKRIR
ncbi:MAG TPA: hypothetical protein PLJ42_03460 [Chitinophagales bacterium]|jgi:hypothetical protein|nr:hypothetical protein [Chitinophagales bacterium]MBP6154814.1 hypothetical protein [Chitinophagales bacterium]HQV77405.1 hypothetical protein [Chitinophagales bacterium]HQW78467.1 hypothetical protein [Chitinophagales bacterium]HRB66921.1 hypothetical protein [Chitinophagales bacterium]